MLPSANKPLTLAICGTIIIILGTLVFIFWPAVFQRLVTKELTLSPTSQSFEVWNDTSKIPLHMEIYFFNWTNPHELKIAGKKPVFTQLGPYTFLEKREKVNVIFNPENNTVSYGQRRTWYFQENKSNGSLSDVVTQLNVVALSAIHKTRHWSSFWTTSISLLMSKLNDVHVTKTIDELLFTGYSDPLIDMGKLGGHMVDMPPFDKFGWFYMRNGSTAFDGNFNMATGQDSIANLGVLRNWNYQSTSKFYKPPCNGIEGSAGEFWPPLRTKDEITLFSADICRPLTYEYKETVQRHGIFGYKYVIGDKTLSNSTARRYPHEKAKYFEPKTSTSEDSVDTDQPEVVDVGQCFCNGDCLPSGMLNVTACRYGAPAYVSLPHFHKADPIYRQLVEGMNPSDEKHGFSITLEPRTGIPIDVAARLQVNILLQPSPHISLFNNPFADVPKVYFPMFWFNEHAGITEDMASDLRLLLKLPTIGFYSSIATVALGSLLVVAAAVLYFLQKSRDASSNFKLQGGLAHPGQKTELVYLDTTLQAEDNQTRLNRQLYPKLIIDKQDL